MLHLFAYKDYGNLLKDALNEGQIAYHCDNEKMTPLMIALQNQSFNAIDAILSFFKMDEKGNAFLTLNDLLELANYQT